MFEKRDFVLTEETANNRCKSLLDAGLSLNGGSASYAYSVNFDLTFGSFGHVDIIFNRPTAFIVDKDLNDKILKILTSGFYPYLSFYPNNGPEFVATGSKDFATAMALRFNFKKGQFKRLEFDSLADVKMYGSKIPLMDGYVFDIKKSSGMVALSGMSGTGKTTLALYMLACALKGSNTFPGSEITIIDPKLDKNLFNFAKENKLKYVSPSGNENDYLNSVKYELSEAIQEIEKRQRALISGENVNFKPKILFIDEAMALTNSITENKKIKEHLALINRITLTGRSASVFLWLGSQAFEANTVMTSSSRDQMALKILLSNNPTVNECRYLFKDFDPSTIVINRDWYDKGFGIASAQPDNNIVSFMAPFIRNFERR